jgi:O-antigen/teichoic acid export membrane protein
VLGPGYEESAELLRQLTPYVFAAGLSALVASALNYLGEARRRLPIAVGDLLLTAGLTAGGLALFDLSGAAYAADVVSVLYVAIHVWLIHRLVGLPMGALGLTLLRTLLAAAAAAGVLLAYGTSSLEVWEWLVGGAGALAAYFGVLLVTGELGLDDLAEARSLLKVR